MIMTRKLNTDLRFFYSVGWCVIDVSGKRIDTIRRLGWAGHVARSGEGRVTYRNFVGKPKRRKPFGRPKRTWEDNIKMDPTEVEWGMSTDLVQDRDRWRALVNAVINLRFS